MNNKYLPVIVLVVIALGLVVVIGVMCAIPDWNKRGQFGEMFGVLEAFFSGMAFIGLIYTILLQREEMQKQLENVERSNRLQGLATLVAIYSDDEQKYKETDQTRSLNAKVRKEKILSVIELEFASTLKVTNE